MPQEHDEIMAAIGHPNEPEEEMEEVPFVPTDRSMQNKEHTALHHPTFHDRYQCQICGLRLHNPVHTGVAVVPVPISFPRDTGRETCPVCAGPLAHVFGQGYTCLRCRGIDD